MLGGVGVEQGGKGKEEGNPFLRNFQPRLYQETIFHTASKCNALVVLPTGMGKTAISMMLAAQRLHLFPSSKILILAPTKPLVQQHMETFQQFLNVPQEKFALFTGEVSPEKRRALWKESQIIFSTPQGLENDIISSRINLEEASLLVFDEAHKAVGDYAYVFLAKEYARRGKFPKILGLTASPGSEVEKIMEVCRNLRIEEVEVRTDEDPDVKPYIQEVEMEWVKVQLPESFQQIQKFLKDCYAEKLRAMQKHGYLNRFSLSKTELLELQGRLHGEIAQGNKDFNVLRSISLAAEALKVVHALELLETQGIAALWKYLQKLQEDAAKTTSKAVKNLM
ncbi:DEAD/DEAH box helicase, partial [Candidatus Woesearchaeota archaeon]|nr:DEAD/DEAH box helicase [Candidatus Woesearchaeota archaeon]